MFSRPSAQTDRPSTESNGTQIDVSGVTSGVISQGRVQRIPFPVEEYNRLPLKGSATVTGDIYLIDASGRKIYGRQTRLYLNPVTSYSRQWYTESYLGGKKMTKADPRLFNYLRFTTSDAKGHFAFYGVPPGRYYLIGVVRCGQECGYDSPHNIRIAREITVGNETLTIDLNRPI